MEVTFEARCSCGRVIELEHNLEGMRDVMKILHPDGETEIDNMDELGLLSFLAARHEASKGNRHKMTVQQTTRLVEEDLQKEQVRSP